MARPTKYKAEFCDVIFEKYLESCTAENKLPSIWGYAIFLGVIDETLEEWGNKYPKFSAILKKIRNLQKEKLVNKGLDSTYNSTIAKMLLNVNHGMKEGTDLNLGGQPGNRTPIPVIMFGTPDAKNDNT